MASSSSSVQERSISCPKQYDAFISHRGPDVKNTLAKHLYERLQKRECRAFLDREEIEGGECVPAAISNGIRSSAVQIAIFSKGYADSSWCLDELVLMLEQKRDEGALFIPVFYDVKPWELRHIEKDKSQYAQAFSSYQSKGRNLDRLDAWKKALQSAADIFGYERSHERHEDLCEKIVSRVVQEMQKRMPLIVARYPIALDELVRDFEMSCPHTARLVGIFGLGGSGKTTIATELFNRKRTEYGASSFLSDVRESNAKSQLYSLQNQLFKDLFNEKTDFTNVDKGTARLKYRLSRAKYCKFLIVVDDVDSQVQLDALLPEVEGILSSGSLVIITTRDQSVLTAAGAPFCYKMKPLDMHHAKDLFCSHALLPRDSPIAYDNLVDSFIEYCRGLPLALKVLGAHVRSKGEHFWELELEKVREVPPEEIMQRLKISFDGLNKVEQQIFIDVACFFNKQTFAGIPQIDSSTEGVSISVSGPPKIYIRSLQKDISYGEIEPISIWKMSGWSAVEHAVQTLQQKCLLEVIQDEYCNWRFEMHDHLRDLGRQMAAELGPPRLWQPHILGRMAAKGFKHILENPKARCFNSFQDSSLNTRINYFTASLNDSAEIKLLWLELQKGGGFLREIPRWIPLRKLHYLYVQNMELWKSFQQQMQTNSQDSFELRRLHIKGWDKLQKLPELGQLERLNTLELRECYKLETIPVLSSLKELLSLHIVCCTKLKTISDLSSLTGLQSLYVRQCDRLKTITGLSSLTGLQSLHIQRCRRLETIFSLSSLTKLRSLHMQGYVKDRYKCELKLSEEFNVVSIRNLERIAILGCGELQRVKGFEELQRLKNLVIEVPENGYAWVRNCVGALRRLPSECTVLIGNAVENAMDRLNEELFCEVMDSPTTIYEIDREAHEVPMRSSSDAITIYALLCECAKIDVYFNQQIPYAYNFKSAGGGHVMFTVVLPPRSQFEFILKCREGWFEGRVAKGFKATVNEGEEGKALTLLQNLVDSLCGESMEKRKPWRKYRKAFGKGWRKLIKDRSSSYRSLGMGPMRRALSSISARRKRGGEEYEQNFALLSD